MLLQCFFSFSVVSVVVAIEPLDYGVFVSDLMARDIFLHKFMSI